MASRFAAAAAAIKRTSTRAAFSFATFPTWSSTQTILLQTAIVLGFAAAAGFGSGALRWQPLTDSRVIGWIAAYALGRSLMEEFVFRAMALPHPKVDGPYPGVLPFFRAALLPLLFSIASHVYTTQRPPRVVAKDASFLSVVSGASILATMAYYNSGGSFWAAWACHFLLALPWLIGAGGYKKMHTPPTLKSRRLDDLAPAPVTDTKTD